MTIEALPTKTVPATGDDVVRWWEARRSVNIWRQDRKVLVSLIDAHYNRLRTRLSEVEAEQDTLLASNRYRANHNTAMAALHGCECTPESVEKATIEQLAQLSKLMDANAETASRMKSTLIARVREGVEYSDGDGLRDLDPRGLAALANELEKVDLP